MSSLKKYLFRSFCHFLIGLFVSLALSCMSSLYILEINHSSVVSFAIIFSHSKGCLFTLLIVSFAVQKLLNLIRSHFFYFCFSVMELYKLLVCFGNGSFVSCFICYYFLPFQGLSFHLAYSFLCCAKAFYV